MRERETTHINDRAELLKSLQKKMTNEPRFRTDRTIR
jgi:hypothetical protein